MLQRLDLVDGVALDWVGEVLLGILEPGVEGGGLLGEQEELVLHSLECFSFLSNFSRLSSDFLRSSCHLSRRELYLWSISFLDTWPALTRVSLSLPMGTMPSASKAVGPASNVSCLCSMSCTAERSFASSTSPPAFDCTRDCFSLTHDSTTSAFHVNWRRALFSRRFSLLMEARRLNSSNISFKWANFSATLSAWRLLSSIN